MDLGFRAHDFNYSGENAIAYLLINMDMFKEFHQLSVRRVPVTRKLIPVQTSHL